MNSLIKSSFIFAIGVAVGSVATWKFIKDKYEQIALDEIGEVKKYYSDKYQTHTDNEEKAVKTFETENHEGIRIPENPTPSEPDIMEYAKELSKRGYIDYSGQADVNPAIENIVNSEKPYVITPEEFGSNEEYDTISLYHYTDGVLADDGDDRIVNIGEIVGIDYASHIGEFEDDAVHIRNDRLKCDFEVLRSAKSYTEDVITHPF